MVSVVQNKPKILLIEDEPDIRQMLIFSLEQHGYQVVGAESGEKGWAMLMQSVPDLILLDWMMPDMNGIEFLQRLRAHEGIGIPVILLTARSSEDDQIMGFEAGADDYVIKPFSPKTLVARMDALLRRTHGVEKDQTSRLTFQQLTLDLDLRQVKVGEHLLVLGPTEFKFLHFFLSHPDKVYSREDLLREIWGEHMVLEIRTVDVHIRRLRKALSEHGFDRCVKTIRGAGYCFRGDD